MSETTVLLLGIIVVGLAVGLSVVLSLARVAPPAAAGGSGAVLPVSVHCPATGDVALADIGYDWGTGELAVVSCERFWAGEFECDRECFPTRVLVPAATAG